MKKRNNAFLIMCSLVVVFFVLATLYAFVTYCGKPITEIPTWAIWLIFG